MTQKTEAPEAYKALEQYYKHRYEQQVTNGLIVAVCIMGALILILAIGICQH